MAPQKSPAFQFYPKDFVTGTATMSLQEVGAYMRLLCYQWDAGSVPTDPNDRARICGCSKAQERELWKKVGKKFSLRDDAFLNERLEEERHKQAEYRQLQSNKGKAGANGRWKPTHSSGHAPAIAVPLPVPQPNDGSSSPSSSSKEAKPSPPSRPQGLIPRRNGHAEFEHPRFDVPTFWHMKKKPSLGGDGEKRLMAFYRWLVERVERTGEDTEPRLPWLDRCFAEWLDSSKVTASSVPGVEETKRMLAALPVPDPVFDGLTTAQKIAKARELREAEAS